jgi:uncharacterized membrane protein YfcA
MSLFSLPAAAQLDSHLLLLAAVPITGFAAGFINTLAGSGSLITLPILILLGLPANVANGTNRVGVLLQNIVAVAAFRRSRVLDVGGAWKLVAPAVAGSLVGAALAVDLDEALMVAMLFVMLLKPERWLDEHATGRPARLWVEVPMLFAIGVYGGFIQAGVGIFLIAGLVLAAGFNVLRANALKNLVNLVITAAALVVFVFNHQVNWGVGFALALGQAAGAWVAARMAVKRGAPFVRWAVIAIVVLSAGALLAGVRV